MFLALNTDKTFENTVKKDSAHSEQEICHKKQSWEEELQIMTETVQLHKKIARPLKEASCCHLEETGQQRF